MAESMHSVVPTHCSIARLPRFKYGLTAFSLALLWYATAGTIDLQAQTLFGFDAGLSGVLAGPRSNLVDGTDYPYPIGSGLLFFGTYPNYSLGLKARHHLDSSFSLSGELALNSISWSGTAIVRNPDGTEHPLFTLEPIVDASTDPEHYGLYSDSTYSFTYDGFLQTISLEILTEWRLARTDSSGVFGIALGPSVHYVVRHTLYERLDVIDPFYVRLTNPFGMPTENNGRYLLLYDGDDAPDDRILFGPKVGFFWDSHPAKSGYIFNAGLYYDFYSIPTAGQHQILHRFTLRGGMLF